MVYLVVYWYNLLMDNKPTYNLYKKFGFIENNNK